MNVDLMQLAGSRGRLADNPTVDPVTAEVVRDYMETVCFEMATYVSRSATTPILNQSNERNASILDGRGRLAALSVGMPQFMLTSTLPVRFALDFLGVDASTVNTEAKGSAGDFAQDAEGITIDGLQQTAWSTQASVFTLTSMKLELTDGETCF